jgi:hypothetical protein
MFDAMNVGGAQAKLLLAVGEDYLVRAIDVLKALGNLRKWNHKMGPI